MNSLFKEWPWEILHDNLYYTSCTIPSLHHNPIWLTNLIWFLSLYMVVCTLYAEIPRFLIDDNNHQSSSKTKRKFLLRGLGRIYKVWKEFFIQNLAQNWSIHKDIFFCGWEWRCWGCFLYISREELSIWKLLRIKFLKILYTIVLSFCPVF